MWLLLLLLVPSSLLVVKKHYITVDWNVLVENLHLIIATIGVFVTGPAGQSSSVLYKPSWKQGEQLWYKSSFSRNGSGQPWHTILTDGRIFCILYHLPIMSGTKCYCVADCLSVCLSVLSVCLSVCPSAWLNSKSEKLQKIWRRVRHGNCNPSCWFEVRRSCRRASQSEWSVP